MKIKVCGLRDPENVKAITALAPDYMGFIFYGHSPRFVGDMHTDSLNNIHSSIKKIAVFVNESAENIEKLIDKYGFDAIQLHGSESPEFCNSLRHKAQIIKAFGIDSNFNFDQLEAYTDKVDFFLFDTKTDIHGGSGKTFDWAIINKYMLDVPFFLSGGIGPENLEEVKNIRHPQFYGVDLNSKFETSPGIKNIAQLEKAFKSLSKPFTNEVRS
jgi:phosphoribosylanthranilate isomerase